MAGEFKLLTFASGVSTTAPSGTTPLADPTTTRGDILYRNATELTRLAVGEKGQFLTPDANDDMSWTWGRVNAVAGADYTILDDDGYHVIEVDTNSADRTITLPTAADNTGRIITVIKSTSDTGNVAVDGEGAETINGLSAFTLSKDKDYIRVKSDGTQWIVLGMYTSREVTAVLNENAGNGAADADVDIVLTFSRINNMTTLSWPQTGLIANAASPTFLDSAVIPSQYRPTNTLFMSIEVVKNGTNQGGVIRVASNGDIFFYNSSALTANWDVASHIIRGGGACWHI